MAKKKLPDPTEAELAILQVLWHRGPSTVRDVWAALGEKGSYTTTLKFLQIMREKGLVQRDDREHSHVFTATLTEADTQNRLLGGMIDRVFSGSASRLVLRALAAKPVSPAELDEIKALLAEAEKKQS
jgi:predicted transcriptional regulator